MWLEIDKPEKYNSELFPVTGQITSNGATSELFLDNQGYNSMSHSDNTADSSTAAKRQKKQLQNNPRPKSSNRSYDFLAIVADDDILAARQTTEAVRFAISLTKDISHVTIAPNVSNLLETALIGNSGYQADALLIDQHIHPNVQSIWTPKPEAIIQLASRIGIEPSFFIRPNNHAETNKDKNYTDLLYYPDGITFSILLRLLGFRNAIFIASGNPPSPYEIHNRVDAVHKLHIPMSVPLIDGIVFKDSLKPGSEYLLYALSRNHDEWLIEIAENDGPTLNKLVRQQRRQT